MNAQYAQQEGEHRSAESPSQYRYGGSNGITCMLDGFKIGWGGNTYGLLFWGKEGAVTATRLAGIRMNLQYAGSSTFVRKSDVRAPGKQGIFLEFREPVSPEDVETAVRHGRGTIEVTTLDALGAA